MSDVLPTYTVIIAARDEQSKLGRTLMSLDAQTHPPAEIIIVDDGSRDDTVAVAREFARSRPHVQIVERRRASGRARGAPIVRAFNAGLERSAGASDVVVKLDADLYLPPHYFAWTCATFGAEPRAGIVGGLTLVDRDGHWRLDSVNTSTVAGVAKAYRRTCLRDIGGLQPSMGWDGIDEYAARARGWTVRVLSELSILHYDQRGSKQSWLRSRWEEGRGNHFMGYRWSFIPLRIGYRMLVERPPIIGGAVLGISFAWHRLTRAPQVPDEQAIQALRAEQSRRLRRILLPFARQTRPDARRSRMPGPAYGTHDVPFSAPTSGSADQES